MRHEIRCRSAWPGREDRRVACGVGLLAGLRAAAVPIAAPCAAASVCGRCVVEVLDGASWLDPADADERRCLAEVGAAPGARLACRVKVRGGPVTLRATYW